MIRRLLIILAIVLFASPAWAATKYVGPSGSAAWGDCTSEGTLCSVATANSNAAAGDLVYFVNGTYTTQINPSNQGSSHSNRITFQALNSHLAIIDVSGHGVYVQNKDYISIKDFKILIDSPAGSSGVRFDAGSVHGVVTGNLIDGDGHNTNQVGIYMRDGGANMLIDDNEVTRFREGISAMGSPAVDGFSGTISNNYVHDANTTVQDEDGIRVYHSSGSATGGDFTGLVVEKNTITGWSDDGIDTIGAQNVEVRFNLIHDPNGTEEGTGIKMGGDDGGGGKFHHNLIYNLTGGTNGNGIIIGNSGSPGGEFVYGNVIYNVRSGILLSTNTVAYNNTIVDTVNYGIAAFASAPTTTVRNNIIYNTSNGDIFVGTGNTMTGGYNAISDAAKSGTGTYNGSGDDFYSISDPFTDYGSDDFTLASGTTPVNNGTNLGTSYEDGLSATSSWPASVATLDQDSYGAGWEIGAFVYSAVAGDPTVSITATDSAGAEEGQDTGTFSIDCNEDTPGDCDSLVVAYTVSGTATYPDDFANSDTSPVTITNAATPTTVTITPEDDSVEDEGNETVIFTITDGVSYDLGSPSAATVNIADNDTNLVNWGDDSGTYNSNYPVEYCMAMSNVSPSSDNMKIDSITINVEGVSGDIRMGVYTGGSSSNPQGSTLIWDAGLIGTGSEGEITIYAPGGGIDWAKDTRTWVAFKGNNKTRGVRNNSAWVAGNEFRSDVGRWKSTGMDTDEDTAFESTWVTDSGSFDDYWYNVYISYQIVDIGVPVISNPLPSGEQECTQDPTAIILQVTSDEDADCRYYEEDNDPCATAWASMTVFSTTGGTTHQQSISKACDASYEYCVKCRDAVPNESEYASIDFSVGAPFTAKSVSGIVFGN